MFCVCTVYQYKYSFTILLFKYELKTFPQMYTQEFCYFTRDSFAILGRGPRAFQIAKIRVVNP